MLYNYKGQNDLAIADFTQVIALNPQSAEAYNERGYAYQIKCQYDRAITDYDQAIALNPQFAEAYHRRGNVYQDKCQYDRAITDYDQAIALNPQLYDAYFRRGGVYLKTKQYDLAIANYNQTIALQPQLDNPYYIRGLAYEAKGLYDHAITDYNQSIVLNPQNSLAYYRKGYACDKLGRVQETINAYRQFIACASPQEANYIDAAKQSLAALEAGTVNQNIKERIEMQCPFCMSTIHEDAEVCPNCHAVKGYGIDTLASSRDKQYKSTLFWTYFSGAITILIVLFGLRGNGFDLVMSLILAVLCPGFITIVLLVRLKQLSGEPRWFRKV